MKLHFLGGADEVGASCTLVELEGHRLLVDAGVRMGAGAGNQLPNLAALDESGPPDEILLTHAHSDHTGALPVLVPTLPPTVPIRVTAPTQAIARVLLEDALKIMAMRQEREAELPLYAQEAVEATFARMQQVPYLSEVPLCGGALKATWIPSGHILGAASIYIQGKGQSLWFSGDVSIADQRTVPGMVVPDCQPDIAILESTYGNRRHADRAQQETALALRVAQVIAAGGKVLIPAFAVGRSQEVILILAAAMDRGQIPPFPIWVDGMIRAVNNVYSTFPQSLTPKLRRQAQRGDPLFYTQEVQPVGAAAQRRQILGGPPCCIVASSGMLTGGASAFYAAELADSPEHLIAITGYQDEESPGRALLALAEANKAERSLVIGERRVAFKCQVETYSLSAHADAGELTGVVRKLAPQTALLVHGDQEARQSLAPELDLHLAEGVHLPQNGEVYSYDSNRQSQRYGRLGQLHGVGAGHPPDEGALAQLATYIAETRKGGLYRIQELAEFWWGTAATGHLEVETMQALLAGAQRHFVADRRRPYLYALAETKSASGALDAHRAQERVNDLLPPEAGLFRCSIRQEDHILELAFHFPEIAQKTYAAQLEALQQETGWTIKVRPTPHQEKLFEAAQTLLPAEVRPRRAPALRLEKKEVSLDLAEGLDEALHQQIRREFTERTGYQLVLVMPGTTKTKPTTTPTAKVAPTHTSWEINRAYAEIRHTFEQRPHQPHRIGRKTDHRGEYIEVSFISPEIGGYYEAELQQLTQRLGWPIRLGAGVHQQQIAAAAGRWTPKDCGLQRAARLFVGQNRAVVQVEHLPDATQRPQLEAGFLQETGFTLEWETRI